MIFRLNKDRHNIQRVQRNRLFDIGWKEEDFQNLLFKNLEKILQDEELLLIMQSRKWQEEPDLMAIDSNGDLYVFELKAWESQEYNLLQALRYGQIYGQYSYESLNDLFLKFFPESQDLLKSLNNKFGTSLTTDKINRKQRITQHIRCGLSALPFETVLPSVATSYMLGTFRQNAHFGAKYKTKDNRYLRKERMKNDGNDLVF